MSAKLFASSVTCGRSFGVPLKLHWSLFVACPVWFFLLMREWRMTPSEYAWGMSLVLCLVVSMYLHEVGHLLAMRLGGMKCTAIVMHGFGGATVPESPALHTEEFGRRKCLALGNFAAGPGANIALAAVFFMARRILKLSGVEEGPILDFWHGNDPALWFMYAAFMNVALAIYNLLPIYPLDGGHIFFYMFSFCFAERFARYATTVVTFIMGVAMVCVEAVALAAGRGSKISLVLVAGICLCAVLVSCSTSYDSYMRHKRLSHSKEVGVGVAANGMPAPVRLQEMVDYEV